MKVKIKLVDPTLPLPQYQTPGAVAFDLYARHDLIIGPNEVARIPTNLIIAVPTGYMLYLKDRSSTAKKKGLLVIAGVIDQDFHGPEDEILLQVYNFTKQEVIIKKAERIGQGIFIRVDRADWEEVIGTNIKNVSRGGFGSTN